MPCGGNWPGYDLRRDSGGHELVMLSRLDCAFIRYSFPGMRYPGIIPSTIVSLGLLALGCVPTMPGPKFTVVPTKTPGVVFVIVHPKMAKQDAAIPGVTQPGNDKKVGSDADYIMLCDGRPVDGMHCDMLTEAALARFTYHPAQGNAPTAVDEDIASAFVRSYSDIVIESHGTMQSSPPQAKDNKSSEEAAPPEPPAAPPASESSTPPAPSPSPTANPGADGGTTR